MIQCSRISRFADTQFTMLIPLIRPSTFQLYLHRISPIQCEQFLADDRLVIHSILRAYLRFRIAPVRSKLSPRACVTFFCADNN
jgi:hypothetical protein